MTVSDSVRGLEEIFLRARPLIDVRAPVEFAQGAAPGAVNLPVLNDEERAAVGLCYKEKGQAAAVELGRKLVSGANLEQRLSAWTQFARKNPDAYLYCFRGGLRSQSVAEALSESGTKLPVIEGGYKRIRRFLIETLERLTESEAFAVVSGYTGSGKTEFLRSLVDSQSGVRVCDLERAARHRGSAFGRWSQAQPSQADFENDVAVELLRASASRRGPIWIEDESRMIGGITIPEPLFNRLSESPVYVIEDSVEGRARRIIESYLVENYDLAVGRFTPEGFKRMRDDLERSLVLISRRIGGVQLKSLMAELHEACRAHEATHDPIAAHTSWVVKLLETYYDPLYLRHLEKIATRVVWRGPAERLTEFTATFSESSPA